MIIKIKGIQNKLLDFFTFSNLHRRRRLEDEKWLPIAALCDRKKNKKDVEQKSQKFNSR